MRSVGRRQYRRKRHKKNNSFGSKFFLFLVFVLIGYLLYASGAALFRAASSENISADFQILEGRSEFSSLNNPTWAPAFSGSYISLGDSIKTLANSRASLEISGGNFVYLSENTEIQLTEFRQQSSRDKYTILLTLVSGEIWIRVSEDFKNTNEDSTFAIKAEHTTTNVRGTVLDISTQDQQDIIRLIKGSADVTVALDKDKKDTRILKLGVNQKLIVNNDRKSQIAEGIDLIEGLDNNFKESEWHLQNLERFSPQEVAEIRRIIELKQPVIETPNGETPAISTVTDLTAPRPEFTFPEPGKTIPKNPEDSVVIEGVVPENTRQVVVNNYPLSKFQEGDRKWVYIASKKFGTLSTGNNTVSVYSVSGNGDTSAVQTLNFIYEGDPEANGQIKNTEVQVPSESTFADDTKPEDPSFLRPQVSFPPQSSTGTPYQTSSKIVTIQGTVDPKTQAVEVEYKNETLGTSDTYRLKQFEAGDPGFSYIANADYQNMAEGKNMYIVRAIGPNDKTSEFTVNVIYTPLDLDQ